MTPAEQVLTERCAAIEYVLQTVLGTLLIITGKPEQIAQTIREQAREQLRLAVPAQRMDPAESDQFVANIAERIDGLIAEAMGRMKQGCDGASDVP